MTARQFTLSLVALLFLSIGCKRQSPRWDAEMLVPLVKSEVAMADIVQDSLLETNGADELSLVYRDTVFHLDLTEDLITLPDTFYKKTLKLDSLVLDDRTIQDSITLGEIARSVGGVAGQIILNNHGGTAFIPDAPGQSSPPTDVDGTSFFQTATLEKGWMDIRVENNLPVDIENFQFVLRNKIAMDVIVSHTFPSIPSGTSDSVSINLAGKSLEGVMEVEIVNMDIKGNGFFPIDTNDALITTITIRDVELYEAYAVFPEQNLIDIEQVVPYKLNGQEIKYFRVKEGDLNVIVTSTVEDTLYLTYTMPGATNAQGDTLIVETKVPPAPPGGSITITEVFNVEGYTMDLTGPNKDTFNTYSTHVLARIDSTGRLVNISKEDSVLIDYTLDELIAEYATGYFGQWRFTSGPEYANLDMFKNVRSGAIDLEEVNISMNILNEVGIRSSFIIHDMTSLNAKTENLVYLTGDLPGKVVSIPQGGDNPLVPGTKELALTSSNSNIKDLIENLPTQFGFYMDLFLNLNYTNPDHTDFAYYGQAIDVSLDIEMPLSFIASKLTMVDTVDFTFDQTSTSKRILGGAIQLKADNGFPLDADLQLWLYDENWTYVDTLFSNTLVKAAKVDSECKVNESLETTLAIPVNPDRFDRFSRAKKAIVVASFDTEASCNGGYPKIYSDYRLAINIAGKFNYAFGEEK